MNDVAATRYPWEWFRDSPVVILSPTTQLAVVWSARRLGADDRGRVTSPRAKVTATHVG